MSISRAGGFSVISRETHQFIRLLPHGTDHHNDLMPLLVRANGFACRGKYLFGVGNAGTAKFLNDERHGDGFSRFVLFGGG
jgi:hypothetical protein